MRLLETEVAGVFRVLADPHADERGFFARLFCPVEFAGQGITFEPRQASLSRNLRRHTLRGMHYCTEPESKLVHCTRGRVYDVAVDLRRDSATWRRWTAVELSADNAIGHFIPPGVAHGFLTLCDDSDVMYHIDRIWRPGYEAGSRWNDPAFAINWPAEPEVINERDASWRYLPDGR